MTVTINGTTGIDAGASLEADAITLAGSNVATQTYADTAVTNAPGVAKAWVSFNGTGTVAIQRILWIFVYEFRAILFRPCPCVICRSPNRSGV